MLHGAWLEGYVTSKKKAPVDEIKDKVDGQKIIVPNSEYEDWLEADQQVFSFLLTSISMEILVRIAMEKMVVEVWTKLEEEFTSQTRARTMRGILTHGVDQNLRRLQPLRDVVQRLLREGLTDTYLLWTFVSHHI
jgi:hypothetical protein